MSYHPCRSETSPLNHATLITPVVHYKVPSIRQPHSMTQAGAQSNFPSLMNLSSDMSRQTSTKTTPIPEIVSIVAKLDTGIPGVPAPISGANLLVIVWSQQATSTSIGYVTSLWATLYLAPTHHPLL